MPDLIFDDCFSAVLGRAVKVNFPTGAIEVINPSYIVQLWLEDAVLTIVSSHGGCSRYDFSTLAKALQAAQVVTATFQPA